MSARVSTSARFDMWYFYQNAMVIVGASIGAPLLGIVTWALCQ